MKTKTTTAECRRSAEPRRPAGGKDDSMLAILARASAVAIVERHAPKIRKREALIEAIARLALIGLEGHVRLWEQSGKGLK